MSRQSGELTILMVDPQPCVAILQGHTGSGKTTTCLELARRAAKQSIPVFGLLEVRVFRQNVLLGYDSIDLESGERFVFARLSELSGGTDWLRHPGLRFAFSQRGMARANGILQSVADRHPDRSLIVIDEFGRLEKAGTGLCQGILGIARKPPDAIIVCTCRTDLVEEVTKIFRPGTSSVNIYTPTAIESLWDLCIDLLLRS